MFQGLEIKSTSDITDVQKECSFVWVDYDEFSLSQNKPSTGLNPTPGAGSILKDGISVEDEFDSAREVHSLASETITTLFEEIRLGAEIDGGKVKQAVNGCVDSILRNPDASVWLTRIQAKHEATAQHSLNVSALSIVMAKSMGMTTREMEDIGVCGMLHDVGKTSISTDVLSNTGPLGPEEMAEMQRHTRYGRDPLYAKIVAIAEAYDTMTTRQPYRDAVSPSEAIQELYAQRGKQFDEDLVIRFIDSVGIFPPGTIVEMVNGEVGIVLSNTNDKLRPRVIMILDSSHEPMPQRIADLSQMDVDDESNIYQIKTTHSDGAFGIDVGDFQRAGLRMG